MKIKGENVSKVISNRCPNQGAPTILLVVGPLAQRYINKGIHWCTQSNDCYATELLTKPLMD
jgi:hypothetical protein